MGKMNKKCKSGLIFLSFICGLFLCGHLNAASPLIKKLQFLRDMRFDKQQNADSDILAVCLDSPVYDNTAANFADIRITNKDRVEIPFVIKQNFIRESKYKNKLCPSKILSLNKLTNNRIEVIIRRSDRKNVPVPGIMEFKTPNKNYEKQIAVYGSNDLTDWKELANNQTIFDYSQVIDLANNSVILRPDNFIYYKAIISNFLETSTSPLSELVRESRHGEDFSRIEKIIKRDEPFKINKISLKAKIKIQTDRKNETKEYPVTVGNVINKPETSEILITTSRQPLVNFRIETISVNYSRKVLLKGSNDQKKWSNIVDDGKIISVNIADYKKIDQDIVFPEKRFKYYNVIIVNGDAPSIDISSVKAFGNVYHAELLNKKENGQLMLLYYGGKEIPIPKYDVQEILEKINNPSMEYLILGEPENNPDFEAKKLKPFLNSKPLFYIITGAMLIILGWAVFKNLKKIESIQSG